MQKKYRKEMAKSNIPLGPDMAVCGKYRNYIIHYLIYKKGSGSARGEGCHEKFNWISSGRRKNCNIFYKLMITVTITVPWSFKLVKKYGS